MLDLGLNLSVPENRHPQENSHSLIYSASTHTLCEGTVLATPLWFPGYGESRPGLSSTGFSGNVPFSVQTPRSADSIGCLPEHLLWALSVH